MEEKQGHMEEKKKAKKVHKRRETKAKGTGKIEKEIRKRWKMEEYDRAETRKKEIHEKLSHSLEESGSDSDEGVKVYVGSCYVWERPNTTDFIECSNCFRRYHITWVSDKYMIVDGLFSANIV